MDCKNAKENLVFFLEKELSPEQRVEFEDHLKICPACSRLLGGFSQLWGALERRQRIQPSPHFRSGLKRRIIEYQRGEKPALGRLEGLVRWTRPAVAVAVLLICVFLGYTLGSFPQRVDGQTTSQVDRRAVVVQQFFDSHYLNPPADLPATSVVATYLDMISEE
ncbi:MAG: anti-sigma factor [Candidatus Zixiibacteriota bacterium]